MADRDAPWEGTPTAASAGRAGLPDVLLVTRGGVPVRHGEDPGDFYCSHACYTGQLTVRAAGSSVVTNADGEPLAGFLHVPRDPETTTWTRPIDPAKRHAATREVLGAALTSMIFDILKAVDRGPIRVLVTGYLEWGEVVDNPTGDFVAHRDNLDAIVAAALADRLKDGVGRLLARDEHAARWAWTFVDGVERELHVEARRLFVDDRAIDGGPLSLPHAIRTFEPHAVVSMGVHRGTDHLVEHRADDGALRVDDGRFVHDDAAPERTRLADNFALARAIHRGARR
jgi:hypothetical protein